MVQLVLIVAVIALFVWFLRRSTTSHKSVKGELENRADLYLERVREFVRKVKRAPTATSRQRLSIELQRLERINTLDELLERAEQETSAARGIDCYLEALSFMHRENVEPERQKEIEERIKHLQSQHEQQVLR